MKKLVFLLALTLLLVPAFVYAAPPGCTWEGDPAFRYGWNYLDGLPYNQPGPDVATTWAGGAITRTLGPYSAHATWTPLTCKALDTLCFQCVSIKGWGLALDPTTQPVELLPGQLWYQDVTITPPCSAQIGDVDTVIARCVYANNAGNCDFSCGDCNDPNVRPGDGLNYYSADTLFVTIIPAPPALAILQDSITYVERGQVQAYVGFSLCNSDPCAPPTAINYSIVSKLHVPPVPPYPWTGSVMVPGGECRDAYAILDASLIPVCTYDTLTIIAWMGVPPVYDTCVQLIHIIAPQDVPLFTVPVVTILVLALILAAAVFMRRRAVSRA